MFLKAQMKPCDLAEGPLWHEETNEFVFADILAGRLYTCSPKGSVQLLLSCKYQLGAFLFDRAGDLILFTEDGVFSCPFGGNESQFKLIWQIPMTTDERFNDAICDPLGRIFAGTKTDRNVEGTLWLFEAKKTPRKMLDHLKISNGMGFTGDCKNFYHTDSGDRTIYRYDYDVSTGDIRNRSPFVQLDSPNGAVPDGMTVDSKDRIWTAYWGGNCIACHNHDGSLVEKIHLPASQVSSLTFGGTQYTTLLVTSAAVGSNVHDDGYVWLMKNTTKGKKEFRAAIE